MSAHVDALSAEVDEPRARALLGQVEEQLEAARAELGELARGIHPPALATGGLAAALPELAGRAPIPVELRVDGGALSGGGRGGRLLRLRRGAGERRQVRAGVAGQRDRAAP